MAYIKPSVRVFQDFATLSPAIITPDLDALIVGPAYQFLSYPDNKILADTGLNYTGVAIPDIEYPSLFLGAIVKSDETQVFLDVATLKMHESQDTNELTVTGAKPEEVTSSLTNFSTLKLRGVLPGDTILLKKDSVVGAKSSLTNQGVEYEAKAKGTIGDTIDVTIVLDLGTAQAAATFATTGPTSVEITLANDTVVSLTDPDSLESDFAAAVAALDAGALLVNGLITISSLGAGPVLAALATTPLAGGVNQVDGDVFQTIVQQVKTTLLPKDTIVLQDSAPVSHQVSGLDFEIHINTNDLELAPADFVATVDDVTLGTAITANVTGVESPVATPFDMDVLAGKVYITYRALRQDLSAEITDLYDVNDIEGVLGTIDPKNPLAYAALKAKQNSTTRIRVIGVSSDDPTGFQGALDVASTVDTVYALVPLTQDPVIHAAFSTHCQQFSTPDEGKWRICFINQALATEKTLTDLATPPEATVIDDGSTFNIRVEDADGEFISDGIIPTDVFIIGGDEFLVESVINNNLLFLKAGTGPVAPIAAPAPYEIRRDLSKTQQAEAIAAKANGFASRRTYYVWPDLVGDGGVFVKGYHLAAAIAGMVAGFPPHKGFTNVGIVGFDDVGRSNRYFNEAQLNLMATEGVYLVVQDAPGSIPFSRHQLSTDADIVEFRELSITKNVDFISYFFKRRLATFIGVWNITDQTLLAINQFTQGLIDFLVSQSVEKIGAPLLSGSISSLTRNATLKDHVDMFIDIEVPYPLNNLNVHLVI